MRKRLFAHDLHVTCARVIYYKRACYFLLLRAHLFLRAQVLTFTSVHLFVYNLNTFYDHLFYY